MARGRGGTLPLPLVRASANGVRSAEFEKKEQIKNHPMDSWGDSEDSEDSGDLFFVRKSTMRSAEPVGRRFEA